jgi:2-methylcitrate dehydratase PrpD
MDRMAIRPDPTLNADEPGSYPCVLTLTTANHDTITIEVPHGPGHSRYRLSTTEVEADFRARASGILAESEQDAVVRGVTSLESLPSVRERMRLLSGSITPARTGGKR